MKPLSIQKRRIYFTLFALAFIVGIPILILYSTGYRLNSALNIIRTGGLYISVPYSGVSVFVNDQIVRQTSVFQKNVFVQNLRPESYTIRVEKDGLQLWSKELIVSPQTVTEAYSFLLPEAALFIEITEFVEVATTSQATTTPRTTPPPKPQKNALYTDIMNLFVSTSTTATNIKATTTEDIKIKRKLSVENRNGTLVVSWEGDISAIPHYFCVASECKEEIVINTGSPVKTFDFFPGRDDLVIVTISQGVYVFEIDDRSAQNFQLLKLGQGIDFRVKSNDSIYIKDGLKLYSVSL